MANANRSSDRNPAAAAPAAAIGTWHPPWAARGGARLPRRPARRRPRRGGPRRLHLPQPAAHVLVRPRGRARFVLWAFSATFMGAFTWRMTALLPLSFTVAVWAVAAAAIGLLVLYVL